MSHYHRYEDEPSPLYGKAMELILAALSLHLVIRVLRSVFF
jgi:hypothetical protein